MTVTRRSAVLWVLQSLLAALFLFAGGFKLALPLATLAKLSPLPPLFLKFVSVCEITGAVGLIVPAATNIRPQLTPIAAACLLVIMVGAVVVTVLTLGLAPAVLPAVVGTLLVVVIRGRLRTEVRQQAALGMAHS